MKQCSKCKTEYPLTNEYFFKNGKSLHSHCKKCHNKNNNKHIKKYLKTSKGKYSHSKTINQWGSGIYGIFESGICLYVGESKSLFRRISQHKSHIKNPNIKVPQYSLHTALKQHKNYVIGVLEQTENHKERESFYINQYQPLYN
jgi:hypothetical protein